MFRYFSSHSPPCASTYRPDPAIPFPAAPAYPPGCIMSITAHHPRHLSFTSPMDLHYDAPNTNMSRGHRLRPTPHHALTTVQLSNSELHFSWRPRQSTATITFSLSILHDSFFILSSPYSIRSHAFVRKLSPSLSSVWGRRPLPVIGLARLSP